MEFMKDLSCRKEKKQTPGVRKFSFCLSILNTASEAKTAVQIVQFRKSVF